VRANFINSEKAGFVLGTKEKGKQIDSLPWQYFGSEGLENGKQIKRSGTGYLVLWPLFNCFMGRSGGSDTRNNQRLGRLCTLFC